MKKHYKIALLFVFLGVFSPITISMLKKSSEKNKIAESVKTLLNFEFQTLREEPFTHHDLKSGLNTVFIYFNSECEFCQHEAQSISENLTSFKEAQFVFVSTESLETIQRFSEKYGLNNQPSIIFLRDNQEIFSNRFDATSIPYILVYGKDLKLVKKHKGQLNAKGILRVLDQNE